MKPYSPLEKQPWWTLKRLIIAVAVIFMAICATALFTVIQEQADAPTGDSAIRDVTEELSHSIGPSSDRWVDEFKESADREFRDAVHRWASEISPITITHYISSEKTQVPVQATPSNSRQEDVSAPYEIVEERDIGHKAMGNKRLSDFTLEELTLLPWDKRFSYRVVVGTSITFCQVQPTVEAIIAGLTQHDPDIDEIHLLLYSTKDRVHDMYDIAMATWSTDGKMGGITPEIARSNNRAGYEISLTIKDNFEECLAQISKTEVKFGLSEQTRREFYAALVRCEDQALLEADKHYNPACSNCLEYIENNVMKLSQMYNNLIENCARLREEYGITEEVQEEILWESYEENWPLPALPPEPGCCEY